MNRYAARYKQYLRMETALLGIVLVAAAGLVYLSQRVSEAEDEEANSADRLTKTEAALVQLTQQGDELESAVAQLKALPGLQSFPSRTEALALTTLVANYVAGRDIVVTAFDSERSSKSLGGADYPAIEYTLLAHGLVGPLIGLLDLIRDVPTEIVQTLDFQSGLPQVEEEEQEQEQAVPPVPVDPGVWTMSVGLKVVYQ